jgi:hypothetical protein
MVDGVEITSTTAAIGCYALGLCRRTERHFATLPGAYRIGQRGKRKEKREAIRCGYSIPGGRRSRRTGRLTKSGRG